MNGAEKEETVAEKSDKENGDEKPTETTKRKSPAAAKVNTGLFSGMT